MLDSDLLVGLEDIALRLGLKRLQNVHYYVRTDPTFPQPIGNVGVMGVWSWPDVEEWARTKTFRKRTPPVHAPRAADFQAALERVAAELGLHAEDLVGAYEIGHRLGFERTMAVHGFMRDGASGFPAEVARIDPARATWIWWWPDVESWAELRYPDRIEGWRTIVLNEQISGQENGRAPAASRMKGEAVGESVPASKAGKASRRKKVGGE